MWNAPAAINSIQSVLIVPYFVETVEPSTKGKYLATIQKGDYFEVFETKEAEGYTWIRIFDSVWVADDGTWMEKIESLPDTELNLSREGEYKKKAACCYFSF